MKTSQAIVLFCAVLFLAIQLQAADSLRLNQRLDYSSDSQDGPLITGENMNSGAIAGKVNYVIMYGEACFNSKRQARRTVELYEKYKDRINFVVIDLDLKRSDAQQQLVKKYYEGSIPHVLILDRSGKAVYNSAGEVDNKKLSALLEASL